MISKYKYYFTRVHIILFYTSTHKYDFIRVSRVNILKYEVVQDDKSLSNHI